MAHVQKTPQALSRNRVVGRALLTTGLLLLFVTGCLRVKPQESQAPGRVADGAGQERPSRLDEPSVGDEFRVKFETSKGDFVLQVHPSWAPRGAARFRELVEAGFYDDTRFFRVVPGFMVQFGLNGDPKVQDKWRNANLPDDPVRQSNTPGMVTYAMAGPNTRTTQIFINYGDNSQLDGQGFSPFAQVISGMEVVRAINSEYGEQPDQGRIQSREDGTPLGASCWDIFQDQREQPATT
jgi:peptidyl-prolyl cis-trans isomerase A (cyclophilin A)